MVAVMQSEYKTTEREKRDKACSTFKCPWGTNVHSDGVKISCLRQEKVWGRRKQAPY